MRSLIKKILLESFNGLSPEEIDEINKMVDREMDQRESSIDELKKKIKDTLQLIDNINNADESRFDDKEMMKKILNDIIIDNQRSLSSYQTYLRNWENIKREDIFDRISKHYISEKQYKIDRQSRTFGKNDIINLFVDALEGGSNYWYWLKHLPNGLKKNVPLSEAIGDWVLEGGYIQFYDAEGDDYDGDDFTATHSDDGLLGTVDMDSILDAVTLMKKDYPDVWDSILDQTYDANDADIFLQLCVMGDVVFG